MQPFDLQSRTRFVFGAGAIAQLGLIASQLRGRRAFLVSDHGLIEAGHFDTAATILEEAGITVASFHEFGENPTSAMVDEGVRAAADFKPDLLVGLGGGSSMDCCKGINFVYCCGGSMRDYHGVGKATAELMPMIAIPTTAGTGSEAQSFALISDSKTHVKMACGDARAACRIAILDPELTVTQPRRVTALTGIDAIAHAVETYVTKRRNPISIMYSRQSFQMLAKGFEQVLADPNDLESRSLMQVGACLAGMAIETSMLGAAHATANPLTARFDVVHGQAVGLMLPAVIRLNGREHAKWYAELVREVDSSISEANAPELLAELVTKWLSQAGLATKLTELTIPDEAIEQLAQDALSQWTGTFNPVPLDQQVTRNLYRYVQ
jgi:alcohol dehydrogenase